MAWTLADRLGSPAPPRYTRDMGTIKGWALTAAALAAAIWGIIAAGPEWAEAIVQGIAAVGGVVYWLYRSRPKVTLRLWEHANGVYIELANTGNRVAKQVKLHCDPPIPYSTATATSRRSKRIGPTEDFGDMDRGQRHTLLIRLKPKSGRALDTLEKSVFQVSHNRAFWFGRHTSRLDMGGSGWHWLSYTDAGTPLSYMSASLKEGLDTQNEHLERVGDLLEDSL